MKEDIIFFKKGLFIARCEAFHNDTHQVKEAICKMLDIPYDIESFHKINTFGADYYFIPNSELKFKKDIPYSISFLPNKLEKYWLGSVQTDINEDFLNRVMKNFTYINE